MTDRAKPRQARGGSSGSGLRVAVVVARFNEKVTGRLLDGALKGLEASGVSPAAIQVAWVPGSFEIPVVAKRQAMSGKFDAVVCLGAVIRSDTPHFDYVAGEAARGIMQAGLDSGVPVIFGVLTLDKPEQAEVRTLPDETNRGYQAAITGVEMAKLLEMLD